MGTRADFYTHKDNKFIWLGSIAWDGYPDGIDEPVLMSNTEESFIANLKAFFAGRDDVTLPEEGWPWPWDDSCTTDYAYCFINDKQKVLASCFGGSWFDPKNEEEPDEEGKPLKGILPDMADIKNIQHGKKSGFITITQAGEGSVKIE